MWILQLSMSQQSKILYKQQLVNQLWHPRFQRGSQCMQRQQVNTYQRGSQCMQRLQVMIDQQRMLYMPYLQYFLQVMIDQPRKMRKQMNQSECLM